MAEPSFRDPCAAVAALDWLARMGVERFCGEEAVDRYAAEPQRASERQPRPQAPTPPVSAPAAHTDATAEPGMDATALARSCATLEDLARVLSGFSACALQRTATNLCLYDGNPKAKVMLIGEAPGRDEDLTGKPFVGRSGQLLDKMLAAIGLARDSDDAARSVFISNVIFWRPPGNRKPTEAETVMLMPFVERLIEIVSPEIIVCLGATPMQRLTGATQGILKLRGRWREIVRGGRTIALLPTLHPAYLLRQPLQKQLAWRDFLALAERLEGLDTP